MAKMTMTNDPLADGALLHAVAAVILAPLALPLLALLHNILLKYPLGAQLVP
jgi:hypothetical protein